MTISEVTDGRSLAARLMRRTLNGVRDGTVTITLPGGQTLRFSGTEPGSQASLAVHSWRMLWRIALQWDIGFAESYIRGEWSTPDLPRLLSVLGRNRRTRAAAKAFRLDTLWRRAAHFAKRNSPRGSRRNIAAHYDLGNAFYETWLDASMTYSAALYRRQGASLEEAQREKIARVCELLSPSGNAQVLEIGCGWGTLARTLADRHGCNVTAITLSQEQLDYARERVRAPKARASCAFLPLDYRSVEGKFDRVVSIEMIEAVGEAYWPAFFNVLRERLKPGGVAVIQSITIDGDRFADYRRNPDFIQRYIFPGGMLPTVARLEEEASAAGLIVECKEFFAESYARTLREWRARFDAAWPKIETLGFNARFRRMWDYYLAYCVAGFEIGALDVGLYRILRPQ